MKKCLLAILSLCIYNISSAQIIRGTVSDEKGSKLFGASVYEESSYRGTSTDLEGKYELRIKDSSPIIVFKYLGFEEQRISLSSDKDTVVDIVLNSKDQQMETYTVEALRTDEKTPMAVQNISKEELNRNNLGQDLPILLNFSPSTVTTSDAGAGVGYTGLRIRGSDATRVNVTVNGIPINDAESQGVFWVNIPDLASSVENIQIQRGVGSSTNGSGAFGASINLMTDKTSNEAYAELDNSFGSFNTRKHTIEFGSGTIRSHWNFQGRLSSINSDGFIDRASANLRSYYLSASYQKNKTSLKAIHFSGKERTYQSWYGTPEGRINGDVAEMNRHADFEGYSDVQRENLLNSGRDYNFYLYDNEVDDYGQDHYQLHFSQGLNDKWRINLAGHYTFGEGFFEQYRNQDDLSDYGIFVSAPANLLIPSTDLIRRRWLRNHFGGLTYGLIRESEKLKLRIGGAYHYYDGDHFGEIVWLENNPGVDHLQNYYQNKAYKNDANSFVKLDYLLGAKTDLYLDIQARFVDYSTMGLDNDQRFLLVDTNMFFFNPKIGLNRQIGKGSRAYVSYAMGNREPTRNDFIDAPLGINPKPEQLHDIELGYESKNSRLSYGANAYFMYYLNQLVLTGELNDVGSAIRTNVPESYRAGIELQAIWRANKFVLLEGNYSFSQNKISNFTETIYDYTNGFDIVENQFSNTDISFSPSNIAMAQVRVFPAENLEIALLNKYVGLQYLDNTANLDRALDPYFTSDLRLRLSLDPKFMKEIEFTALVNNLFNTLYSSNGYTYSYIFGTSVTENFYYPQAGRNFLIGLRLNF